MGFFFLEAQERVPASCGKRAISVGATEVLLYDHEYLQSTEITLSIGTLFLKPTREIIVILDIETGRSEHTMQIQIRLFLKEHYYCVKPNSSIFGTVTLVILDVQIFRIFEGILNFGQCWF